jgi:cytochrome c oxidase subunit III
MNAALTENRYRNKIHPHKFALMVACASIIMMFAALTSAYIVRHAQGNWLEFKLPDVFMYSTLVILLSSVTLQGSYYSFLKEKEQTYKSLLGLTLLLGLSFLVLQYQGWLALFNIGVEFNGNPSGSFVYVISGLHAMHILAGIAVLFVALVHAYSLNFKVTKIRKRRLELSLIFWHFLGFLWVYLFLFIQLQQS